MGRITNNICKKFFYYPLLLIKYIFNSIISLFTNKYQKVYKDEKIVCNLCNNTVEGNDNYCNKCLESFNICTNCKSIRIKKPVLKRAEDVFQKNKMHKTKDNNAVLFYVAVKTKHFAVAGDSGIHEKVAQQFWHDINNLVLQYFSEGKFTEGLCKGIELCGQKLKEYFPIEMNDVNEQSDEISFS